MSKELRALLIVFGVLAGLVVLGFAGLAIAFGLFVKHVAAAPRDPAALRRTSARSRPSTSRAATRSRAPTISVSR